MAFNLTAWQSFGELTTFRQEVDDDPYLTDEKAETTDQEDMVGYSLRFLILRPHIPAVEHAPDDGEKSESRD